ncbi:hypothetical protein [Aquipuribacter sp. SD81]|uniref:hypothetical protein n=1 Tax=Aquipuribacter sp. SD81 TaxID=3127703 RepID=UPI003017A901
MLARVIVLLGALGAAAALTLVPLLAGGPLGPWWTSLAFVAVVAAVGYGWTRLLQVPVGWGVGWIVVGTGVTGAVLVQLDGTDDLEWVPAVFAVGVVVAFVHQMGRRDGRPRLVESVSASVSGQAVVLLGTGWLAADAGTGSVAPLLVGATGCVSAALVMSVPWPRPVTLPLATVAGGLLAGALGGWVVEGTGVLPALALGAVSGATTAGLHVLLYRQPTTSHRRAAVSAGAACVMAAGLGVHVGARLTLG